MQSKLNIKIQASKIYLTLSVFIYCLGLFATWYYFYTLWLSVILSGLLSLWLLYFLPKSVNLTHPNSIVKMVLDKNRLTIEKKQPLHPTILGVLSRIPISFFDYYQCW